MHKRITFRNMDHSKVIEKYANEKLQRIEKFLQHERSPVYIDLLLEPSKVHAHNRVELRIKTPQYNLVSNFEGPEFYPVLDRVIDVMYEDLHKKKEEKVDNKRIKGLRNSKKCWYEGGEGCKSSPEDRKSEDENDIFEE